ncbi:methyltransferase family protein [Marinoscillum furvescens]|uniref:Lipid A phosphate methyltransferase n=1 Tax=Marinoscillum furvescens DSM 4134 TaxID=1122208 RepID=A0A3D9L6R2_MARFU|nr:isoprenylcysteine carboxylmethyltransferase family protein [Marinoscillum furvescens]RED99858.1 lipid A phosphate methyltransferase [Marinoscillum furvescens DSM 4134]
MADASKSLKQGRLLFRYRGLLPLLLLAPALALTYWQPAAPSRMYVLLCVGLSLLGTIMRMYIVGHTPKGTSGRNTGRQLAEQLNTTGAYAVVQHPLYLANFIIWLGLALYPQNALFLALTVAFFFWVYRRIFQLEEAFLKNQFGDTWRQWSAKTPTILPNIWLYKPPTEAFNWKKVLRKEKNGLLAIVLVFTLFELTASLGQGNSLRQTLTVHQEWLWATGISGGLYLLIKVIMKKTSWLK